jgi:hypothetical protein
MAEIPSYEQWIKDTKAVARRRSDPLKVLDETLKSPVDVKKVKIALDDWKFDQGRQGKKWRESIRNSKGAVTNLERAVNPLDKRKLSAEELEALKYLSRMQTMALQKQFLNKGLTWKSNTMAGMVSGAGTNWQKFKSGAASFKDGAKTAKGVGKKVNSLVKGAQTLSEGGKAAVEAGKAAKLQQSIVKLCGTLTPDMDPNKVFQALNLGSVDQFAANVAPFVGVISSGGKAVMGWIGVAQTGWQKHKIGGTRYAFAPQDPEAAFDAVLVLLNREIVSKTAKASASTVAFTGKVLGTFADAGAVTGPAMGLLETLANIFQTVVEYVRDYKELQAANQALRVGALNLEIFSISPLLGCYFLVIQDHSTIINFAVGDYGTPDFVFDVERLVKKIQPVLDKSRSYIHASRYEIRGMEHAKGIAQKQWSKKTGLSKVTGLPGHITGSIADKIDGWIEKPEKPPKVDPARIVGFGPSA